MAERKILIPNKYNMFIAVIAMLILAWWFRYDTHCGGEASISCVAYDRFTSRWVFPAMLAREDMRK
jgi:hypothetical protein